MIAHKSSLSCSLQRVWKGQEDLALAIASQADTIRFGHLKIAGWWSLGLSCLGMSCHQKGAWFCFVQPQIYHCKFSADCRCNWESTSNLKTVPQKIKFLQQAQCSNGVITTSSQPMEASETQNMGLTASCDKTYRKLHEIRRPGLSWPSNPHSNTQHSWRSSQGSDDSSTLVNLDSTSSNLNYADSVCFQHTSISLLHTSVPSRQISSTKWWQARESRSKDKTALHVWPLWILQKAPSL